jgi:hypothetical protein
MPVETIEKFLERVEAEADDRGVYLRPPLPEYELNETAEAIREELGLTIPEDYMRLLHFTDGIDTQRGYLSPLEKIGEHNAIIWFMQSKSGANAKGVFEIRYEPLEMPRTPTYIWLGYEGNQAEHVYDLATGEYHRRGLGCKGLPPDNRDRSLVGMLRLMIYGEQPPK